MMKSKEYTKWTMSEEVIQEVQSFTYLGVEFGRRVGWKEMKKKVLEGEQTYVHKYDPFWSTEPRCGSSLIGNRQRPKL